MIVSATILSKRNSRPELNKAIVFVRSSSAFKRPIFRVRSFRLIQLVLVWLAGVVGCQSERAYWEFADAKLQAEKGELADALPRMKQAVQKSGNDPVLKLSLARLMAEQGDVDSIDLFDQILADPTVQSFKGLQGAIQQRKIIAQQHIGDFKGALATCKEILNQTTVRDDQMLNWLAYCRALAGVELKAALSNIDQAIQVRQSATAWKCGDRLHLRGKTVVANALLVRSFYYETRRDTRIESIETASTRLETALSFLTDLVDEYENRILISRAEYQKIKSNPANIDLLEKPLNDVERRYCGDKVSLVVVRTVRALIYQDLGRIDECNRDRLRVQELNKDANEIVSLLPDELEALELITIFSIPYLDTKGFVLYQIDKADAQPILNMDPVGRLTMIQPTNNLFNSGSGRRGNEPADEEAELSISAMNRLGGNTQFSSFSEALQYLDTAVFATQVWRRALAGELYNRIDFSVDSVRELQDQARRTEAVLRYHRWLALRQQQLITEALQEEQNIRDLGYEPDDRLF